MVSFPGDEVFCFFGAEYKKNGTTTKGRPVFIGI